MGKRRRDRLLIYKSLHNVTSFHSSSSSWKTGRKKSEESNSEMETSWQQKVSYSWPPTSWHHAVNLSPNQLGFSLVKNSMMEEVTSMINHASDSGEDESFAVFDIGVVVEKYKTWMDCFPNIQPFYAIKACTDPTVISLLAYLGAGFDCASKSEIEHVLRAGADTSNIIFANPIKFPSHIHYAYNIGACLMTFDCEEELFKIKKMAPFSRLVLRIAPQTSGGAEWSMENKFGCSLRDVPGILEQAQILCLQVVGVSFHAGSGIEDAKPYVANLKAARHVFDIAKGMGMELTLLDIGGGFFGKIGSEMTLKKICGPINEILETLFPKKSGVKVISEPGRYFVEGAMTMATYVTGKKTKRVAFETSENGEEVKGKARDQDAVAYEYFISESTFGCLSFYRYISEHDYRPIPIPRPNRTVGHKQYRSKIWGPTCAIVDLVQKSCYLPELEIGDWLVFQNIGHYNTCLAVPFNGIPICPVKRVIHEDVFQALYEERCIL